MSCSPPCAVAAPVCNIRRTAYCRYCAQARGTFEKGEHMRPVRRILVAIKDPCAKVLPAVTQAARIAQVCGAQLELFHAIKPSLDANGSSANPATPADSHDTHRRQYLQRLGRIAARLGLHEIKVSAAVESDYILPMRPSSDGPPSLRPTSLSPDTPATTPTRRVGCA